MTLPERKAVKVALREAGLSVRQVAALLRGGWPALVGAEQAELAELRERLTDLTRKVSVETIAPEA